MLLEIVGITDLNGKSKDSKIEEIKNNNSLYGTFWGKPKISLPLMFFYKDSRQCMVTTEIQDYEYVKEDKLHIITTKNSIYYIKEIDMNN